LDIFLSEKPFWLPLKAVSELPKMAFLGKIRLVNTRTSRRARVRHEWHLDWVFGVEGNRSQNGTAVKRRLTNFSQVAFRQFPHSLLVLLALSVVPPPDEGWRGERHSLRPAIARADEGVKPQPQPRLTE